MCSDVRGFILYARTYGARMSGVTACARIFGRAYLCDSCVWPAGVRRAYAYCVQRQTAELRPWSVAKSVRARRRRLSSRVQGVTGTAVSDDGAFGAPGRSPGARRAEKRGEARAKLFDARSRFCRATRTVVLAPHHAQCTRAELAEGMGAAVSDPSPPLALWCVMPRVALGRALPGCGRRRHARAMAIAGRPCPLKEGSMGGEGGKEPEQARARGGGGQSTQSCSALWSASGCESVI